jgi:GntR family transcriptional regulator, transcriptional repressor for pyruvate dehydrogenase complex
VTAGARASEPLAVKPVRRVNVSAEIAERIADEIERGALPAGSRLRSERELSDLYQVGRSSVREAIKALESRGLVEGRQGEGRFVRALDLSGIVQTPTGPVVASEAEVRQLYEARLIVEPAMAALAAQRGGRRDLATLHRMVNRHAALLERGAYGGVEDKAFHLQIAAMADNPLLAKLLGAVLHVLHAQREPALRSGPPRPLTLDGHRAILAALDAADPEQARDAMVAHLAKARETAVSIILQTPV